MDGSALDPRVRAALDAVPELAGATRVTTLSGGLTNTQVKVETPGGAYVVRIAASDSAVLVIDRADELKNSVIAARAGVGAPVVAHLPEQGVLVVRFLEGRTLGQEDVRRGDRLAEIAALLRRLHAGDHFHGRFDMVSRQRGYLRTVEARGFRLPDRYLEQQERFERIATALAASAPPLAPCHNDLVAENLIDGPDGLRLIDYDYAGMNDPYWDLGDLCNESDVPVDRLDELVGHYAGEPDPALVARVRLWSTISKYGWTLWAVIRHGISGDESIHEWGMAQHRRALVELDDPGLDDLIAACAAGPRLAVPR